MTDQPFRSIPLSIPCFGMPETSSVGFDGKGFKYYCIDLNWVNNQPWFSLKFTLDDVGGDVSKFLEDIARNPPFISGNKEKFSGMSALPPNSPLDIKIDRQCHVIIELNRSIKWRFSPGFRAITTKCDYGDKNIELRHLVVENNTVRHSSAPVAHSNIAYFKVVHRDDHNDVHAFNIHSEFMQGNKTLSVIYDPDIGNDGGKIP